MLAAGFASADVRAALHQIGLMLQVAGAPVPASTAVLSGHEIDEINGLPKQQQAHRLLQRAVNRYQGALDQIAERVDGWRGELELTPEFNAMLHTAYNSADLRVRSAAIEISLAAYKLEKTSQTVDSLLRALLEQTDDRSWRLWVLGLLGNRGVETARARQAILGFIEDPDPEIRKWAVNSLAMLGTDDSIEPLLKVFHDDPSLVVKERAACSLADSGMLTREQRMKAVPDFLRFMDDPTLDATVRSWVFQALRDITGQKIGSEPAEWRSWASKEMR